MQRQMWDGVVSETICVKKCPDSIAFSEDGACVCECTSKYFMIHKNSEQQYECVRYCHVSIEQPNGMSLCVDECPSDKPFVLNGICVSACPSRSYMVQDYSGFKVCTGSSNNKLIPDLDHFGHWQCVDDCSAYGLKEYGSKCFRDCGTNKL